jgi:hypothetical protein
MRWSWPETRIPFMAMPDASEALLTLAAAPRERLRRMAYNVGAFSASARQSAMSSPKRSRRGDRIKIDEKRQGIVDSWPAGRRRFAARADWGSSWPTISSAFRAILIPAISRRYTMISATAFAPATVSNVGCGFDVLGFALDHPGDEVTRDFWPAARMASHRGD